MGKKSRFWTSLVTWKAGWLGAVISASQGLPVLGSMIVFATAIGAAALGGGGVRELRLLGIAVAGGYMIDSSMVIMGVIGFPDDAQFGGPSTIWMSLLWANLAMNTRCGLVFGWLDGRPWLAMALGALTGPLAYLAGARVGAVDLPSGKLVAFGALAVTWALAFPLIYLLRERIVTLGEPMPASA